MKFSILVTLILVGFLQLHPTFAQIIADEAIISGKYVLEQDDDGLMQALGMYASGEDRYTVEYKKVGDVWKGRQTVNGKIAQNDFRFGEEFDETVLYGKRCRSISILLAPNVYKHVELKCTDGQQNTKIVEFDGRTMKLTFIEEGKSYGKTIVLRKL